MREYWRKALENGHFDEKLADKACAIAAQCAPYTHPRLHAIDAKIETALVVMTEDERRQQARELIQEAFRERAELTESKLIEHDPIDRHATALHATTRHSTQHPATAPHNTSHLIEGTVIDQEAQDEQPEDAQD
jgi:hypothetical protein